MKKLTGSVGHGGSNRPDDVRLVQKLINANLAAPLMPLKEDGFAGQRTTFAIAEYQRRHLQKKSPDGLIMPNGPTFRSLVAGKTDFGPHHRDPHHSTKHSAAVSKPNAALVDDPRIRAMLDVLGYSEGTNDNYGVVVHGKVIKAPNPADVGKVNVVVTDLSRHPNMLVQVNPSLVSSAAGRYQFLHKTWDGLKLPDFQAHSQDVGAVMLMRGRHMIEPLLNGDFDTAVQRGSLEWASLPDANKAGKSHYGGQPARTLKQLRAKYSEALARYQ